MTAASAAISRETLLRNPALINGRAAALRLVCKREKCTPAQALRLITELKGANEILALFKAVMPEEFKQDSRSRVGVTERFLNALGFPVGDLHQRLSYGPPLNDGIHIESLAGHICDQCAQFDDLPVHYQLAIHLLRDDLNIVSFEEESEEYQEHRNWCWTVLAKKYRLPNRLRPKGDVDFGQLLKLFEQQSSPVKYLPLLSSAIDYNTGCIFLDFDPEQGLDDDIEWTPANIVWLRQEFKRAQEIGRNLDALYDWIDAKPRARVMKILRLYKQAEKLSNEKKAKRRIPDAERGTLVRIL